MRKLVLSINSFSLILILLAWVGVMVEMSSLAKLFRIVVLPALSRPRSRILNSRSGEDFSFLHIRIISFFSKHNQNIPENAEETHCRCKKNKWSSDENSKLMPTNKLKCCWIDGGALL